MQVASALALGVRAASAVPQVTAKCRLRARDALRPRDACVHMLLRARAFLLRLKMAESALAHAENDPQFSLHEKPRVADSCYVFAKAYIC